VLKDKGASIPEPVNTTECHIEATTYRPHMDPPLSTPKYLNKLVSQTFTAIVPSN